MAKIKINSRMVIKKFDGTTYFFKNGVAKISGCRFSGKQMTMTLKEFKEVTDECCS